MKQTTKPADIAMNGRTKIFHGPQQRLQTNSIEMDHFIGKRQNSGQKLMYECLSLQLLIQQLRRAVSNGE